MRGRTYHPTKLYARSIVEIILYSPSSRSSANAPVAVTADLEPDDVFYFHASSPPQAEISV